ncbi:NEAT domain-containing protein [Cohnella thailandensis]|uniref:NEAT domain-containing protein n=1 Tax=Cohnella thailandensis TaxID=557557 RepID=A0A841SSE9_9BACL|nr:NEAT domain-containing protein [Cohnella thailandensis]MBB6633138.1 NEAT domain-containing protein [Cohnella thailandensis]MBP1975166.1 heme-binding NEAT domain protein [Cohnella thailandensis]
MNRLFKKSVSLFVALGLLFSLLQIGQAAAATVVKVPDGEYSVPFRALKDNSEDNSAAAAFMELNSGKLIVEGGQMTLLFKVNNYEWYRYFGHLTPGKSKSLDPADYTESTPLSTEPGVDLFGSPMEEYYATFSVPVESLTERIEMLMHIIVKAINYDNWYNVQLSLDTSKLPLIPADSGGGAGVPEAALEQLDEQISVVQSVYEGTTEGYADGDYYPGSKVSLYSAILSAQETANDAEATPEQITQAYNDLVTALANHERLKVAVDRAALQQLITEATDYADNIKIVGSHTGTAANGNNAVVWEGETPKSNADNLKSALSAANSVHASASATQFTVNSHLNLLSKSLAAAKSFLTTKETVPLIVLDSLQAGTKSSLASYFEDNADVLRSNYYVYEHIVWRNIANVDKSSVTYSRPTKDGAYSASSNKAVEIPGASGSDTWATQLTENRDATLPNTSGIIPLTFKTLEPSVTQTVYLSFNGSLLTALDAKADEAQELLDDTSEGNAPGQYPSEARSALQTAIDSAKATAANLGSTRLEISGAATALQTAVDTFKASTLQGVNYSVAHATYATFSTMDGYLLKPASLSTVNGETYATLTIKDSSIIPEFKVKQNGDYVDAAVVSANEKADTRTVKFKVENPGAMVDAQVKIAQGAYQATHDIRLNFNGVDNSALSQAVSAANALLRTAKAGTEPGQYPAQAIAAFKLAIDTAGEEAVRIPGSQQQTDAALAALQSAAAAFKATVVPEPVKEPEDGAYTIDYRILKFGTNETSVMQDYVTTPARLDVSGSKLTVSITLKQDKEITALKFNGAATTVVSRDPAANTRVVSFPVNNLSEVIDGWVKIEWPAVHYFNEYDIQLKLDAATLKKIESGGGGTDPGTNPGTDPGTNPGTDPGSNPGTNPGPGTTPTAPTPGTGTDTETDTDTGTGTEPGANPGPTISFSDTKGHWAEAAIQKAVELGIAQGFEDGSFRPNATVSRAEIAAFLSRALKLDAAASGSAGLSDADKLPAWAKPHILSVAGAGLMTGYADSTFGAGDTITRAEIAIIVARALKLTPSANPTLTFADASQIPAWARGAIAAVAEAGLMEGKDNNRFDAKAGLTRAEALTLIVRLLDALHKEQA